MGSWFWARAEALLDVADENESWWCLASTVVDGEGKRVGIGVGDG